MGFIHITDATAAGLTEAVQQFLAKLGIDMKRVRGQGYDGASVMSGIRGGVQKLIKNVVGENIPVPYVHCSSHNLNLVINDAVESNTQAAGFFNTIQKVYKYFSKSLNRWAELALGAKTADSLKLKKLCPTRWTSRIDSVRAIKNRYTDIMRVLTRISLQGKTKDERDDSMALRKQLESFEFIVFLVLWERLLLSIKKASVELQSPQLDLCAALRLLSMAENELRILRNSWESILSTALDMSKTWGVTPEFQHKRDRTIKKFFDELASDERLRDPEKAFKVNIFYAVVDTALMQLRERFCGQGLVSDTFSFLFPKNLTQLSDEEVETPCRNLCDLYKEDFENADDLISEVRSFKNEFSEELKEKSTVTDIINILLSSHIASSMPELLSLCILFVTLPVTVASAERSFSKLKLIKNYLRSTMAQDRLDGLAVVAIENNEARKIDLDKVIRAFANMKARRKDF